MMNSSKNILLVFVIALLLASCGNRYKPASSSTAFEVKDFNTLTNWNVVKPGEASSRLLYLDYVDAMKGFSIPSIRQTTDGYFDFEFSVKNKGDQPQKFLYKLYYQNESYKFPECAPGSTDEHPLAHENFYGSWDDTTAAFVETPLIPADGQFHRVTCQMRITGNPRNEKRYYYQTDNQAWTRNPRVGEYSFMLVVSSEENLRNKIIPDYISNIGQKHDGHFVNPYYYFLYGEGSILGGVSVMKSGTHLCVVAKPDLKAGVYSNPQDFDPKTFGAHFTKSCGSADQLYLNAPLGQFRNNVDAASKWDNIPVIADVLNDNYSLRDYNWNRTFFKKDELISIQPETAGCPCRYAVADSVTGDVVIRNEASHYGDWKKQSIGVITRHGFTYGKFTVKVKLTELLNKNGVWNGITNAIWLVTNGNEPWNYCRECNSKGYLPRYGAGKDDKRSPLTAYSEIDFEILKTVPYCPYYAFPPAYLYPFPDKGNSSLWNVNLPPALNADSGNVMISCTNWDMACPQPSAYDVGCQPVNYGNQTFVAHRWDYWYRALTERCPAADDELFAGPYYYFQIEWKPTEIIWRIGPEKDKMRVVGYMNDAITSIPNNQMLLVISQEFHNTNWWPGSPFEQQFIPFPATDLVGRIMEITVE